MRKKLLHFQDNAKTANVIEPGKPLYDGMKGRWHAYFGNKNAIVLELGCGKGTYTIALAQRYPLVNFIGIDIKGARLWAGSQKALQDGLMNVAFLRTDIAHLDQFFTEDEIAEIYITFPDPRPRDKQAKKRLTSPRFLALYQKLLLSGGKVHLKTDNDDFFSYTREILAQSNFSIEEIIEDVHGSLPEDHFHRVVQTPYEKRFLAEGVAIKYLRFLNA